MRLLVTRPGDDAEATAAALRDLGVEPVLEPLIEIRFVPGPELDLAGVQALLVTSANGLRAFCARDGRRDLPVLAVGDASARAARDAGFADVRSAGGDVDDLADLAGHTLDPAKGPLLHVAGTKVAGDLAGMLGEAGFGYRREVLYEAGTVRRLTPGTEALLRDGGLDGVLVYSPRTAKTLVKLLGEAGLSGACAALVAFCLSPNVAAELAGVEWRAIEVADRPEQAALMARVKKAAGS